MSAQIPIERLKKPLLRCLDETFASVHGIYLDKGTTLFETIDNITAEEASQRISPNTATIAAQVEHVRFYLDVLDKYMRTLEDSTNNWREIWDTVGKVTATEWEETKERLRDSYARVMANINSFEQWDGKYDIAGAMSILTHTAYHLGGIRVTLGVIRGKEK
ncbi:MAG TPA: DinB family protein [Pyrinomonadaceae bacterium]|nr:DinB family protein [Pyrinomonadaceae bacterium]